MYICICKYIYIYIYLYVYMYICICIYIYECIYVYKYIIMLTILNPNYHQYYHPLISNHDGNPIISRMIILYFPISYILRFYAQMGFLWKGSLITSFVTTCFSMRPPPKKKL